MLVLASMMVMTISAAALPFNQAQQEALFLSDKMAYELGLNEVQYEMIYEINLDYFLSVNNYNDLNGVWWARRNADLRYILTTYQYNRYINLTYFYRPLVWRSTGWYYPIYTRYTNRTHFYSHRPTGYVSYRGGHNRLANDYYAHRGGLNNNNHPNTGNHNYNNNFNNNHNYGSNNGNVGNHNNFNNNNNHNNNNNFNNNNNHNSNNFNNNRSGSAINNSISRGNINNGRSRIAGR